MAVSITISIDQNSQSITNNTSNVTVTVRASWTGGSYNQLQKSGWLKIDGTTYNFTSSFNYNKTTSGTQVLFTKTVDVKHNNDGTKTLACSASYTSGVSSGTVGASASKVLTTIPRKSTLSVGNGTLNTAQTLTVTRQSTSFTHSIKAKCGTSTLYIKADGSTSTSEVKHSDCSISFKPPLDWASQNTTGTSLSVTYTITTYNGSTNVGSNSYTKTCTIPSTVVPKVTFTATEATGKTWGVYIQSVSKVKLTISPTLAYGSPIASYKTTIDGRTYNASTFTTSVLSGTGTLTIKTTVTDKRGRSATYSNTISVLSYRQPSVSIFKVRRCNGDGVENIFGEFAQVQYTPSFTTFAEQNNLCTQKIEYKTTSGSEADYVEIYSNNDDQSVSNSVIFPAESNSTYHVRLTLTDSFNTYTRVTVLSTGFAIMHFLANGFGIAFGKIAQLTNVLDIGFQTRFMGGILQPVLEAGTDLNSEEMRVPNTYTLKSVQSAGYTCGGNAIPLTSGTGMLKIETFGEEGQTRQIIEVCHKTNPLRYERFYYQGAWGDWLCTTNYGGSLLWSGGYYMTAGHTAPLAEKVSQQRAGIVLVFSEFIDGAASDTAFHTRFIPKALVSTHPGRGHCIQLSSSNLTYFSTKYLYISDDKIVGHDNNGLIATGASGISYDNKRFVLRYVIGV